MGPPGNVFSLAGPFYLLATCNSLRWATGTTALRWGRKPTPILSLTIPKPPKLAALANRQSFPTQMLHTRTHPLRFTSPKTFVFLMVLPARRPQLGLLAYVLEAREWAAVIPTLPLRFLAPQKRRKILLPQITLLLTYDPLPLGRNNGPGLFLKLANLVPVQVQHTILVLLLRSTD